MILAADVILACNVSFHRSLSNMVRSISNRAHGQSIAKEAADLLLHHPKVAFRMQVQDEDSFFI